MFTKIMFIDNDGDLAFDYVHYAAMTGTPGEVMIGISEGDTIVLSSVGESLIRELFREDKVDLTAYGSVLYYNGEDDE